MDGGTVYNINLVSAVHRCREVVDDDSKIVLDIIDCFASAKLDGWEDPNNALSNYLRFKSIKQYHDNVEDVYGFAEFFPNVTIRHYITPSGEMAGGLNLLNADNATVTWPMQMLGRLDGENAVKQGDGFMISKLREYMSNSTLKA